MLLNFGACPCTPLLLSYQPTLNPPPVELHPITGFRFVDSCCNTEIYCKAMELKADLLYREYEAEGCGYMSMAQQYERDATALYQLTLAFRWSCDNQPNLISKIQDMLIKYINQCESNLKLNNIA